ncbi:MAG TPA: hypothetical protein VG323_19420 [Thermoanaerobaculia bacterium]|nr:hypothetical protein [Thermoanaerobaculia bacterium]
MRRKVSGNRPAKRLAFINVPYAKRYEKIYLAFIAGAAAYSLVPTAAVHDPSSRFQLDRICEMIASASVSFHDLSWMGVDNQHPRTPRLNMTFELGLAVAFSRSRRREHHWIVFDTVPYRLQKALSDLGGIRPRIYDGTPIGLLRELMSALQREKHRPTLSNLVAIYQALEAAARRIKRTYSRDLFDTRPFDDLRFVAQEKAKAIVASLA